MDIDSEDDVEKMESDLKHLAHKVSEYRKGLPDNLGNTIDSVISSRTLDSPNSHQFPFRTDITDPVEPVVSSAEANQRGKEHESTDGLIRLKGRVYENIAAVPLVVKRMHECNESINKSNSSNATIHPAFTRRKRN